MFKPFPVTVLPGGQKVRTDLRPYSDEVEPELQQVWEKLEATPGFNEAMEEGEAQIAKKRKPKKSEGDSE